MGVVIELHPPAWLDSRRVYFTVRSDACAGEVWLVCDACGRPLGPEDRGPLHWACVACEKARADLEADVEALHAETA